MILRFEIHGSYSVSLKLLLKLNLAAERAPHFDSFKSTASCFPVVASTSSSPHLPPFINRGSEEWAREQGIALSVNAVKSNRHTL